MRILPLIVVSLSFTGLCLASPVDQRSGAALDTLFLARNSARDVKSVKPVSRPARPVDAKKTRRVYASYLRGLMYASDGDNAKALKEFKRVLAVDRDSVHVRLKIAVVLMRMGKMKEAEGMLKAAKKIDPENIDTSLALIFLYSYTRNEDSLEGEYGTFLEKAHLIRPENTKISEYLAQFYFYKHRIDDAIRVYEAIVAVNPGYVEGLFWLGYLYSEKGQNDRAVKLWKDVLAVDPAHAPTLNSLGYIYVEEGVNLDEAEQMIKKAIEKEPENGAYLDSLGWLYFKEKKYKLADDYLNKALVFLRDPIVYDHLGRAAIAAGRRQKALDYYREGVKYFPDDKTLQEKLKLYGAEGKTTQE